jgi:hypothetical protein
MKELKLRVGTEWAPWSATTPGAIRFCIRYGGFAQALAEPDDFRNQRLFLPGQDAGFVGNLGTNHASLLS